MARDLSNSKPIREILERGSPYLLERVPQTREEEVIEGLKALPGPSTHAARVSKEELEDALDESCRREHAKIKPSSWGISL